MIKNNYHTHMKYCGHAVGDTVDYIKKAVSLGFEEIGMTDHAPILKSFMSQEDFERNWCDENMSLETLEIYLKELEELKEEYKGKIKIYSGLETEFLPEQLDFYKMLRSKVDYLNFGAHYYYEDGKIINTYADMSYKNVDKYADQCILGMQTGLFNTLVHPDLFMFSYKNIEGKREFDAAAEKASRRIIEAAIKYNIYLEINANGLKNSQTFGDGSWLYPVKDFWVIAKEYPDLKVLIGADAHDPEHLANENVEKVCNFAKELNIKIEDKMIINH